MREIDIQTAAKRLLAADDVLILCHRRPDGDAIGSGMSLYYALKSIGKRSRVECADPFPAKFDYLYKDENFDYDFEPKFIVAVDTATARLLGELMPVYGDKVDLSIDHHKSNTLFAKETLLDLPSPATAELMFLLLQEMGIEVDVNMANSMFTGIVTDTGGLRYASVTSRTYKVSSRLIDCGAQHALINRRIFESNSKERLKVKGLVLDSLEYYFDDQCALIYLPNNLAETYGVLEEELDGLSSIPRTIEGVGVGITIRDLGSERYRISLRSQDPYDSSKICQCFGGGGHVSAAGCTLEGSLEDVKERLLKATKRELEREDPCEMA